MKQYQLYLNEKKDWDEKRNKIIGNESTPNTIEFLEKELDYLENHLNVEIQDNRELRNQITEKIFDKKQEVIKVYKEIKQKLDKIIEANANLLSNYKINIKANLSFNNSFRDSFFGNIYQNQVGTFYTNEGGNVQFNKLIKDIDFDKKEDVMTFLTKVIEAIFMIKRDKYDNAQRYLEVN